MLELVFHDFIRLFQENPLGQSFWFLWMAIILYGFFQTDDRKAKKIITTSMIAWILHFYFMWLTTAFFAGCIGILRMILSFKYQKNIYVCLWIIIILIIFWIYTYDGLLHLIPICTSILWAFAFIFLEKLALRLAMLLGSILWLIFNIQVGSLGWMTNEILTQFILLTTIFRMLSKEGHIHHYREVIHDILHKHKDVDMGRMTILKDSHKIIKKQWYVWRIYKKIKNRNSLKLEK